MGLVQRFIKERLFNPRKVYPYLLAGSLAWALMPNNTSKPVEEPSGATQSHLEQVVNTTSPEPSPLFQAPIKKPEPKIPLTTFLEKHAIPYEIAHDRLFLPEDTIKRIASVIGLPAKDTKDYLCTAKHRDVLFNPLDDNPLLRKAIMTVESHGRSVCNSLNYCGVMQIGDEAVTEVLRILTQYSVNGTGTEFNKFREENGDHLDALVDFFDQKSEGYVSALAELNQDIVSAKLMVNQLYKQYDLEIRTNGYDPELSQLRRELGKYNKFLSSSSEYFKGLAVALESQPELIGSNNKRAKETRRNVRARKRIAERLQKLEDASKEEFSLARTLIAKRNPHLSYLSSEGVKDLSQTQFSADSALDTFSTLWDQAKEDPETNVNVSRFFGLYLQHLYVQDSQDENGNLRKEFAEIDPVKYVLECYNKGHGFVHRHVLEKETLPPPARGKDLNYSDHVAEKLKLIMDFNELFYGHEKMECTRIGSGVECSFVPKAIQDYVSDSSN
jgi:hypothetical protein